MNRPLYSIAVEAPRARIDGDRLQIDVAVRNDADRALLVVSEIRAVEWEAATHTLHVWLGDREEPEHRACTVRSIPTTRALPMRESVNVPVSLPRELWRLTPHADGNATVEHIDLREAQEVAVHVTVADGPFYPPSPQLRRARAPVEWGQCTTVRARIRSAPRSA